jgi:hypothetical protein
MRNTFSFLLLCASVWLLAAQPRTDARHTHERLLCIVGLTGKGTLEDPVRPLFAPKPGEVDLKNGTGIIAWSYQLSDDGKYALAEFVARAPRAFDPIRKSNALNVMKVFEKGKARREEVEAEFKRYKKDFDLEKFGVRLP